MHIPDNYLSPQTCLVLGGIMLPVWAVAAKKVVREMPAKQIPLVGISAAFAFLVMMFNIPLPGGTSGHAVGATLVAILIGPFAACIALTIAILIQALFFGDGGILAFGANCFNMAFVMPFSGYYIFQLLRSLFKTDKGRYIAAFAASYIALNLGAFITAVEFGIQPILFKDAAGMPIYCPYPLSVSLPAMIIPHLLAAGFVEALITGGVYAYINRLVPENIHADSSAPASLTPIYILLGTMIVLSPLGLLATGNAWGEWAASEVKNLVGYVPRAMTNGFEFHAPLPDYSLAFIKNETLGYVISAIVGAAIILIGCKAIAAIARRKPKDTHTP